MSEAPKQSARRTKHQATFTKQERARNIKVVRVLVSFIVLVLVFVLGFFVRSQTAFVSSLGIPVSPQEAAGAVSSPKSTYDYVSARVGEVEDLLETNSLDGIDLQASTNAMLESLMKSTGDPYAAYYDPERYSTYIKDVASKSYAGVGVLFSEYNGRAYVADVFNGSEAEAKGVCRGDFVRAIDGDSSHAWSVTEVVNAVDREEGDNVVITWLRKTTPDAETGSEFTTTLTCAEYVEPNVTTELDDGVGVIHLSQITQNAAKLVEDAVVDLGAQGATSYVLDLRNNPGGYLTQACDIASMFLNSGVIVQIQGVDGTTSRTVSGISVTTAPMVVLVNEYTSSAAEVLAASLQDNQRAQVIGTTTMGKGSVQVVRELSFGGAVRYTAAYYLTPLGHAIEGVGVVPNVVVGAGDASDTQQLVAVDTARSLA